FNHTPVIMASGRELCYVLLTGVCLCYVMTFIILARPTVIRCALLRVGLGLCLSLCYSAIFVKTNRISRIFNCGVKAVSRPIYTSPISQIAICLCIVSVQLVGTAGWLMYEVPDVKEIHPQPLTAVLTCKVSTFSLIMSLVYNMVLILLCTLYAFKTRKIPENFNEAKYIGFTMYSTCIVWLAFLPIYFGTNNDYKIQVSSICMCLSISATVSLTCLFLPKVYLVLFQPYKNVRNATGGLSVNRLAATDPNRPPHNMRFSGTRSQTFHSMTSSAITKSGSSSRLSHRVVNNTVGDDAVDISVQTDLENQPQLIKTEPQGNTQSTQLTISAVIDSAEEMPCCSRMLNETNHQPYVETNGHEFIKTTDNNAHNTETLESISRVSSSSSVHNQNRKSSINLESGIIGKIDYKELTSRKTN
ncbi:metabotropic glutamate receptor 2-like, partial [Contarinia nasturtii]|uniref:metabotropic glutamate receptor 2-like n=1 Tax=Contarinia nasturtii TaxID=265458 RepID=UPI0012D42F57